MEIERKFLVEAAAGLDEREWTEIAQGYLALADAEGGRRGPAAAPRRRAHADRRRSPGGQVREEEEIELDADEFERLWRLTRRPAADASAAT